MMPTDHETLARQCEDAGADRQRDLLLSAGRLLLHDRQGRNVNGLRWAEFVSKLDAEAYLDAALMLVPEGWCWMAGERDPGRFRAHVNNNLHFGHPQREWYEVVASSTALALLAAILRSQGGKDAD